MPFTATIAGSVNDWLSRLAIGRKPAGQRGTERFAALMSPDFELETPRPIEAGRHPVVTLNITSGLHRGASMALTAREYLVGSGDDCDIVLHDSVVKPHHSRLTREWFGYSIRDLRGGEPRPIAPQTVNYQAGEIEALYDIGGVCLSLRQPPPARQETVPEPQAHTRPSWVLAAVAAAGLAVAVVTFVANTGAKQAQSATAIAKRIVAGNQALLAQGFKSVHFRRAPRGELEVTGLITDVAERQRLYEWLGRAHYDDVQLAVQPVSELVEQARRAIAAENLHVALREGRLRIEGTTSQMTVRERIRTLAQDLQGTVAVEDRVIYIDARERVSPPFPVRLRGVMAGNPPYFLTDQGARYFVGGVLPDGAEVVAIEPGQIRFAVGGKVMVYNLE